MKVIQPLFVALGFFLSGIWAQADPGCDSHLLSQDTGPAVELKGLTVTEERFRSGISYKHARMEPSKLDEASYRTFLENTVEIIYHPVEPFGHISLRVGDRVYSFNFIKSTSSYKFSPSMGEQGKRGFVFVMGKEKIDEASEYLSKFYSGSEDYNFPPFDAYSPLLEVEFSPSGMKFKTPSPKYGNSEGFKATLITADGKEIFENPDGLRLPAVKRNGKYYVQSYSCASSAVFLLETLLGMSFYPEAGARDLRDFLEHPRSRRSAASFVIDYF